MLLLLLLLPLLCGPPPLPATLVKWLPIDKGEAWLCIMVSEFRRLHGEGRGWLGSERLPSSFQRPLWLECGKWCGMYACCVVFRKGEAGDDATLVVVCGLLPSHGLETKGRAAADLVDNELPGQEDCGLIEFGGVGRSATCGANVSMIVVVDAAENFLSS